MKTINNNIETVILSENEMQNVSAGAIVATVLEASMTGICVVKKKLCTLTNLL